MKKKTNTINLNYYGIIIVVLLFGIFIGKLIYVSYANEVDGVNIQTIAKNRKSAKEILPASRGEILSSNGEVLARDVNSYTVIAYLDSNRTSDVRKPRHVIDKENTASVLSEYLNMSKEDILYLLNMNAYQVELGPGGRNISEKLKQEIANLNLPGIDFIASSKRYYPFGDFASYIVGYAKKQESGAIVGELGVESYYNEELTGKNGSISYQKDAYGYHIADTPVIQENAKSGNDIYLTIDSNVQMYMENTLEDLKKNYTFEWALVTVANAKTGAILGSASNPSYDPNILNITEYNTPLVSYAYEPGSTMKIFTFMAAMEEGVYNGSEEYLSGKKEIGEDNVTDWNKVGWGNITYDKGFTYSSNVAAANLGENIGRTKLIEYFRDFGFGSKTGIEMANEYSGKISPKYKIEVANASFGQGILTTPIQNIQALTTLANKGVMLKPYIVEKIVDHDTQNIIYEAKRTELKTPVSEETVNTMLNLMYETVNGEDVGVTGNIYKTDSVALIGKTGTAQIASSKGGYEKGEYNNIRSFAGLFPYEDPEYIIYISVKKLQGSSTAIANVVKSIVESIAKYKNIDQMTYTPDISKIITVNNYINSDTNSGLLELENKGLEVIKIGEGDRIIDQYPEKGNTLMKGNKIFIKTNSEDIRMPDMLGWTSNDVNSYCNLAGIKYHTMGVGKVISQSIEVNSVLDKNITLEVVLSRE